MSIAQFEEISMTLGIGGLVLYMLFILYKLSEESNAGKYGSTIIFMALGFGFVGFAAKSIVKIIIET